MKISKEWLEEKNACKKGIEWFESQDCDDPIEIIEYFIDQKIHLYWANWLIVHIMDYRQYVSYAVYAAEQVLPVWEKEFPDNKTPHEAIAAAKKCIDDPSEENKAYAGDAAHNAAYAVSCAAYAVSCAIFAAYASAADAATYAATYAADAYTGDDAKKLEMQIKILKYGLQLLGGYNER